MEAKQYEKIISVLLEKLTQVETDLFLAKHQLKQIRERLNENGN